MNDIGIECSSSIKVSSKSKQMRLDKETTPKWLHKSEIYKATNEDEEFDIPDEFYRKSCQVHNSEDWIVIKNISDYWNLPQYPMTMIIYYIRHEKDCQYYLNGPRIEEENAEVLKFLVLRQVSDLKAEWSFKWFQYILDHPDYPWNYPQLCKNPNVTWELIQAYPKLFQSWVLISSNPNVSWAIVKANPENIWNYSSLSSSRSVTWEIVQDNPKIGWSYPRLSQNSNITWDIIQSNPHKSWDSINISRNPNINWKTVMDSEETQPNFICTWNYDSLGSNSSITWDVIVSNPHKKWNYKSVCKNSNITWDIVINNPYFPWDYETLCGNSNITWDIIQSHPEKFNSTINKYIGFSKNPTISWEMVDERKEVWDYHNLSSNTFEKVYQEYLDSKLNEYLNND